MFINVGVTRSKELFRKAFGLACTSKAVQKCSSVLRDVTRCLRALQSLRADSAVHFLDNLAWRVKGSNPVTSCTFDEATRTANHSAELIPLQGVHSAPSSNSCAVCGGSKTPGFDPPCFSKFDGEGKSARA